MCSAVIVFQAVRFISSELIFKSFGEHEFYMLRVRRFGAMCFASGLIFGNKFLTPEGIKTLFPIFENSLCYKELAVETQHLKCTKTKWTFILCPKFLKQFQAIWKGSHLNICLWQYSGLRVRWVGTPNLFPLRGCNFPPFFFPTLLQPFLLPHPQPYGGA